jgi:hypothetical protein
MQAKNLPVWGWVFLAAALFMVGCGKRDVSKLPTLPFATVAKEIREGRGVAVEFDGTTAIATFVRTPDEARAKGLSGTMFRSTLPTSTLQRSRFVRLCSEHGVEMFQYH